MRCAADWLLGHLPERVLKASDRVPFIVQTRRKRARSERNAFQLGRDYERGLLTPRVERLEAEVHRLVPQDATS